MPSSIPSPTDGAAALWTDQAKAATGMQSLVGEYKAVMLPRSCLKNLAQFSSSPTIITPQTSKLLSHPSSCVTAWSNATLSAAVSTTDIASTCVPPPTSEAIPYKRRPSSSATYAGFTPTATRNNRVALLLGFPTRAMPAATLTTARRVTTADEMYCLQ
ncbi:hypothetical protein V494_05839 [Pseudogymnoascus sp. VKM F-4513 (FW-928)]|nr:hypothetical protein V494_05839 [Pseudogymnoascus sp. VKM F-4513 (FW-928)]